MQRKSVHLLVPALVLFALAAAAGCGSKDKGTNPMGTTEPFESGNLSSSAPNNIFVHRFNTAGSFGYRCRFHSGMAGTVNVAASGVDSPLVQIQNNFFNPSAVTVKTGGYVKWVDIGTTHSVTRP
jgi:plastocyanin